MRGPRKRHPHLRPGPFGEHAGAAAEGAGEGAEPVAGPRVEPQRDELDDRRLGDVQREVGGGLPEHGTDEEREHAAQDQEEQHRAERRAAAREGSRDDERDRGRSGDQQRLAQQPELGHAEVELALEDREADQQAAAGVDRAERADPPCPRRELRAARSRPGEPALGEQREDRQQAERRTAEHHQVRRPPERDVLAEEPVPDVVEGEPGQREGGAGHQQDPADRHIPRRRQPQGRRPRPLLGQHDRQPSGREDPEEAEQDEVVRGVRQRAGVAPVVDVQRDVPVQAEGRGDQRDRGDAGRERGPAWEAADAAGDGGGAAEEGDPAGSMPEPEHEERDGEDRGRRGGEDHLADRGAAGRGGGRGCECSAEHDIEKCNIVWCHIKAGASASAPSRGLRGSGPPPHSHGWRPARPAVAGKRSRAAG